MNNVIEVNSNENNEFIISGYVNATERISRPLYDYNEEKEFEEVISQGTFERALEKSPFVLMLKDHDWKQEIANTLDGTLNLKEDAIGLRYVAKSNDKHLQELFSAGMVKGCSFGFIVNDMVVEEREGQLPLHRINDIDLLEVTLVTNDCFVPAYYATTAEARSVSNCKQIRTIKCEVQNNITTSKDEGKEEKSSIDYSYFEEEINKLN